MRYAFTWVDLVPELFDAHPPVGPAGRLGSDVGYYEAFAAAGSTIRGSTRPWAPTGRNLYWTLFLDGANPRTVDARTAWQHLVPIRWVVMPPPRDSLGAFGITAECFLYPFGLALILTANWRADKSLEMAVDEAVAFRRGARIALASGRRVPFPIDAAAERILGDVRQKLLGLGRSVSPSVKPFTIATVVRGSGYDSNAVPSLDVRRALTGLVTWDSDWRSQVVDRRGKSDVLLSHMRRRDGHAMVAADRSRAVWFPARFCATEKTRALGCYHRNLILASAQTEALGAFMSRTLGRLGDADPASLPWDEHACWERSVHILKDSWTGVPSTYRSASVQRQIGEGVKSDLERALALLGEAGLPDPASVREAATK